MAARVAAVHSSAGHSFSKSSHDFIRLLAGLGVEGDAHCGATMQHLGRLPRQASWPNLRQVHVIHGELHNDLAARGFTVAAGEMGENITTRGIDLLHLPTSTLLHVGETAVVEITGLRSPCKQLDGLRPGLMEATLTRDSDGGLLRLAGVMGVVAAGGVVKPGDRIEVELPPPPHEALPPV
jgi:MOSC domain-containing protein YiiM